MNNMEVLLLFTCAVLFVVSLCSIREICVLKTSLATERFYSRMLERQIKLLSIEEEEEVSR